MPVGSTRPAASSGASAEAHRGRVATGGRDVRGARELGRGTAPARPKANSVEQLGRGVGLAVPLLVASAAGSRKSAPRSTTCATCSIDRAPATTLRLAVRQREEHEVEPGEVAGVERCRGRDAVGAGQRREQVADHGAGVGVGGDVHDLDLGVAGEQPQQLGARVPGRRRRPRLDTPWCISYR